MESHYWDSNADIKIILLFGVTVLILAAAFASIFTLAAMLCQNKAIIAVTCILLSFGLLFTGALFNRMLNAPQTIPTYFIGENGEQTALEIENPKYLEGRKREIVQFFYDLIPGGQAIQCSTMEAVNLKRLPFYSSLIIIAATSSGVLLFKKKNLK